MRRALFLVAFALGCTHSQPAVQSTAIPSSWTRTATPDADFRKSPPPPSPETPFEPPKIEEAKLGNGMRVLFVVRPELPIVSIRFVSNVGADHGGVGATDFLAHALFRGTTKKSARELGFAFDKIGVTRDIDVSYDATWISYRLFPEQIEPMSKLLSEVLEHATYPDAEVEKVRGRREVASTKRREDPELVAIDAAHELLFVDHPYGAPAIGTLEGIRKVVATELRAHHALVFDPKRMTIVAAGAIERDKLVPALEASFASFKSNDSALSPVPTPKPPSARRIVLVDRAGDTQAQLLVIGEGVSARSPGRPARSVLSQVLSRRLREKLREEHGWTYGATGGFKGYRAGGMVSLGGAIEVDHTGDALKEILATLDRLGTDPVSPEELADAKRRSMGAFARGFETLSGITTTLVSMATFDIPASEYVGLAARIDAVSKDDVLALAKQWMKSSSMSIVVVGDAKKLKPQLEALSLGPIEVRGPKP